MMLDRLLARAQRAAPGAAPAPELRELQAQLLRR